MKGAKTARCSGVVHVGLTIVWKLVDENEEIGWLARARTMYKANRTTQWMPVVSGASLNIFGLLLIFVYVSGLPMHLVQSSPPPTSSV